MKLAILVNRFANMHTKPLIPLNLTSNSFKEMLFSYQK